MAYTAEAVESPTMLLTDFLRDIYVPLKGISAQTEFLYSLTIAAFGKSLGRPAQLSDLEELAVARFLAARLRERKPATVAKDRSQIRALWELAARRNLVSVWPTIQRIKVPERVPEAWFVGEMTRILDAASKENAWYCGIPAALWWRALLLVCYDTGERIGSVMALKWSDVREGYVIYRAENRKGRTRDILRRVSPETLRALTAINTGTCASVFPWPRTKSYLWRRLEIILIRAGLPSDRTCKFHKIRKTTASYSEAAGLSAQDVLDHSDPKVTKKYLDPRIVTTKAAPDVLPKITP